MQTKEDKTKNEAEGNRGREVPRSQEKGLGCNRGCHEAPVGEWRSTRKEKHSRHRLFGRSEVDAIQCVEVLCEMHRAEHKQRGRRTHC